MSNIKFVKVDIDESKIVKNVPLTKGEAAAIANFIDVNLIQTIKDADFVTMLFLKSIIHGYEKLCECGGYTGITEGKFENDEAPNPLKLDKGRFYICVDNDGVIPM